MKTKMTPFPSRMAIFAIAAVSAAILAGCAKQDAENASAPASARSMPDSESTSNPESMKDMPMPEANPSTPSAPSETHAAKGTIQSIDRNAGTVKIAHEAVPSMDWPAMTMEFKASSVQDVAALKEGEQVEFHFTEESAGRYAITEISPQR